MELFCSFAVHILVVVFVTSIGIYIVLSSPQRLSPWMLGVLFGVCTILVMVNKIIIHKGRLVDFRFIVMTLAGYVGGPITALVSAVISGSYRWVQGGSGALTGIITIFIFGWLGCLLRKVDLSFKTNRLRQIAVFLGLGFGMATIILLIILITPPWNSGALNVVRSAAMPLLILAPIGTVIIFLVYAVIHEALGRLSFFDTLLQDSSLMLIGVNNKGILWASNRLVNDPTLSQYVSSLSSIISHQISEAKSIENLLENKDMMNRELHIRDERIMSLKLSALKLPQNDLAIVGVISDITEIKQTEKELTRLDRLNLVGEMAIAIAHEVRNPMTTVRGFLQLLRGKDESLKYREYFDLMIDEIDRANAIIEKFLGLSRNKAVYLANYSLKQIVQNLFPLIQACALTSDKQVNLELDDVPEISMDEKEIVQVILNLARNGIESMSCGGKLTIRTIANEGEIVLAVQDEGKGIEPEVLEKIGTPFFTTKDNGTGLGLAVCYSIAARHNAKIDIDTNPSGTTFYVRFKRQ